jgi:hypothetical protein
MAFLEWLSDPETREELREIRAHLRCSEAEAVLILQLGQLTAAIEALGAEVMWMATTDDGEEDEE